MILFMFRHELCYLYYLLSHSLPVGTLATTNILTVDFLSILKLLYKEIISGGNNCRRLAKGHVRERT